MLDRHNLHLQLGQSFDLACDLPAEAFRQGPAVSRYQFRRFQALVPRLDVDAANTLTKQQAPGSSPGQALDPVDVGGPFTD